MHLSISLFNLEPDYLSGAGTDFYDIAPDDQRFVMACPVCAAVSGDFRRLVLVQNFFDELRRVVPQ